MQDLAIFGSSYRDIVKVVEAINKARPTWRLAGFIDDREEYQGRQVLGYPILGPRSALAELASNGTSFFNNVAGSVENAMRIASLLEPLGRPIANLIHPGVDMGHVRIGHGCVLPEGCCVGSGVTIGNYLAARLRAVISHDVTIGDYVFVGVGAVIGSEARIGAGALIGAGATVMPGRTIGERSIVGAGALVAEDVPAGVTVASSVKAQVVRSQGRA